MPIQNEIWKIGSQPEPLQSTTLANEQLLEEMIIAQPQILSSEWMLIGRQEDTGQGGRIDLLAIAPGKGSVRANKQNENDMTRKTAEQEKNAEKSGRGIRKGDVPCDEPREQVRADFP